MLSAQALLFPLRRRCRYSRPQHSALTLCSVDRARLKHSHVLH